MAQLLTASTGLFRNRDLFVHDGAKLHRIRLSISFQAFLFVMLMALVGWSAYSAARLLAPAPLATSASLAQLEPLYALEKDGALKPRDLRGIAFTTARLAAGATAVRDMIVDAWLASAGAMVGYPMVNVQDVENGKVRVTRHLFKND